MTISLATQSRAHPRAVRGNDLYETPPCAVRTLLQVEKVPHKIWEPACGRGAIVRELKRYGHHVIATDIAGDPSVDFLECEIARASGIVTSPPGRRAALFAAHAIRLCPYVALLMRLGFLEAGDPRSKAGRARIFCLDEHPPARVNVFRNRLPMMHRDGWNGRKATSAMAFAWLIWDRTHKGLTTLSRISWEPSAEEISQRRDKR
jgi:hypothetical protein